MPPAAPSTISVRTPQNVSPDFNFTVGPTAPAVFLNGSDGNSTNLPSVTRAANGLLVTPFESDSSRRFADYFRGRAGAHLAGGRRRRGVACESSAVAVVQPTVTLSGVALPVTFAGLVPGQIGVYEIQVNVPTYTPQGLSVPLIITQNGQSQTVDVRVVH